MSRKSAKQQEPETADLASELLRTLEQLVAQQFAIFKTEVREELSKTKSAAVSFGAGAGLVAVSGLLSTEMLVHLLQRVTGLPLWMCYGILAGGAGAFGATLVRRAQELVADVQLPALPETTMALKENVSWLREQIMPTT